MIASDCIHPDDIEPSASLVFAQLLANHSTPPYSFPCDQNSKGLCDPHSLVTDVMKASGCEWEYKVDSDEIRIPSKLIYAERKHRFCFKGTCRPLTTEIKVFRKVCNTHTGKFTLQELTEEVTVGYYCMPAVRAMFGRRHHKISAKMEQKR